MSKRSETICQLALVALIAWTLAHVIYQSYERGNPAFIAVYDMAGKLVRP
jgi:hypothetical protein